MKGNTKVSTVKRIIAGALLLMAMTVSSLLVSTSAHATIGPCADGNAPVNLIYNGKWFWNNWNGTAVNGNHVNFNNVANDGYNDWCKIFLGSVIGSNCTSTCWPFAEGSGMNSRYNGRPVYKFCWAKSQAYCIDWGQYDQPVHNGRAIIFSGASDRLYEVVQSASSYWAPPWANDLEYASGRGDLLPILLGTQNGGPIGQGGGLWMNPSTTSQLQFALQDPALVCNIHC